MKKTKCLNCRKFFVKELEQQKHCSEQCRRQYYRLTHGMEAEITLPGDMRLAGLPISEKGFSFNNSLVGSDLKRYKQPCIYGWFRDGRCLYIGKSDNGLERILSEHHVIGIKSRIEDRDEFRLLFMDYISPEELVELEKTYIKNYRPVYNIMGNEAAWSNIEDKLKNAYVAKFSDPSSIIMSHEEFVANSEPPQLLTQEEVDRLTEEELREYLRTIEEHQICFKRTLMRDKKKSN